MKKWIGCFGILTLVVAGAAAWFLYSLGSIFPTPHALEYDKASFDPLANAISVQTSIRSMDDCTRYTKLINDVSVRMTKEPEPADTICCPDNYCCPRYYEDVLDSMEIPRELFTELRDKLEKTQLREFHKSGDSILLIVDGFLDNSWGFLYSQQMQTPDTTYKEVAGFTIKTFENVNAHWQRVSIN